MENIYVQFDGMVYQQIVGIPMGTNCAPLYDKRDYFHFHITNFLFLFSNIPSSPAYGVYTIRPGLFLILMFYSEGQATFQ